MLPQPGWSCWPCSSSLPLRNNSAKHQPTFGSRSLFKHCSLVFLQFFQFEGLCEKPVDNTHHVFGVGVSHVVQINKFLLFIVQLSVGLSINLYLEELRRFAFRWQRLFLLLLFLLSQDESFIFLLFFSLTKILYSFTQVREVFFLFRLWHLELSKSWFTLTIAIKRNHGSEGIGAGVIFRFLCSDGR